MEESPIYRNKHEDRSRSDPRSRRPQHTPKAKPSPSNNQQGQTHKPKRFTMSPPEWLDDDDGALDGEFVYDDSPIDSTTTEENSNPNNSPPLPPPSGMPADWKGWSRRVKAKHVDHRSEDEEEEIKLDPSMKDRINRWKQRDEAAQASKHSTARSSWDPAPELPIEEEVDEGDVVTEPYDE